jgi:hypothetical protein
MRLRGEWPDDISNAAVAMAAAVRVGRVVQDIIIGHNCLSIRRCCPADNYAHLGCKSVSEFSLIEGACCSARCRLDALGYEGRL